jgi:hypothetical protein
LLAISKAKASFAEAALAAKTPSIQTILTGKPAPTERIFSVTLVDLELLAGDVAS